MGKLLRLLIIAFIAFACKSEQSQLKSDLVLSNLKGRVWKIDKTVHSTDNKCGCVIKADCNQSKYVYNEKGNLTTWYTIDENGITNDSTNYIYNQKGICSGIAMYNGGNQIGKQVPVIQGGKITGYKIFSEDDKLETTLNYVYSGNEIAEEKTLNDKGEVISTIQKEYSDGQIITQSERDKSGAIVSKSKFNRNANNDVLECLTSIAKDNMEFKLTYEYEYDSLGNWVKQTQFYDGAIINITIRNIEYFR
jgi:hypothetical protein